MDGPDIIVQDCRQHNSYSNHNTNYLQQEFEQASPQQSRDNISSGEQYDRSTDNTSNSESSQRETSNCGNTMSEEHQQQHLSSSDSRSQQTFLFAYQNDGTINESRLGSGNCDIDQNMDDDDDAFIAFCADSSPVLNDDLTRKYHINKLYQPLTNNIIHRSDDHDQQQQQHQQLQHQPHQMEQDDEYLLYQELRFIESSARELSSGPERTELSKILEDEDCHEVGRPQDEADPLDCLNLTNIIDSFGEFCNDGSPLIDTCNGERDPMMSGASPQESSGSPVKPDSSGLGNEYSPSSHINPTNEHVQEISPNNQYNSMNINHHQYRDMYSNEHTGNCYSVPASDPFDYGQSKQAYDEVSTQHRTTSHQDITREIDDCIQILSDPPLTNHHDLSAAAAASHTTQSETSSKPTITKPAPKSPSKRKMNTTDASDESQGQRAGARKLKKRRSTPAIKKSAAVVAANQAEVDRQKRSHEQEAEHIKELSSRLLNEEEESMMSDNSVRSEGSKRNPTVNHYRRRTANARERIRMREINQAFEKLKKVVPAELIRQAILESEEMSDQGSGRRKASPSGGKSADRQSDSMKLTKITTLRLAHSYIAKLTDILNQSPENPPAKLVPMSEESFNQSNKAAKVNAKSREDKKSKVESRRSRTTTKKVARVLTGTAVQNMPPLAAASDVVKPMNDNLELFKKCDESLAPHQQKQHQEQQQQVEQVTNDPLGPQDQHPGQRVHPQTLQTAFISIPSQRKSQYISTYPNQQQMLISQPMSGGAERQIVTPVAVAILGIPSNNGQAPNISNSRGLQFVTLQNSQQHIAPMVQQQQQQSAYNLQLSQAQPQNRAPQQVTLTLDDLNGLSVLRLTNPHVQNQSVPIQIKTTNNQFGQNPQQTQIFTASNGLNYAFRPIPSVQQTNNTNLLTTFGGSAAVPTNFQQATIQVCNNNQLLTQNISNNNMSNNIIPVTINNNISSSISGHPQAIRLNGQTMCNINQSSQMSTTGTTTTGNISEQPAENPTISSSSRVDNSSQQVQDNSNQVFQISQQRPQQQTMFVPSGNLVSIASPVSTNQSYQSQSIPMAGQAGSVNLDQSQPQKANIIYINPIGVTNAQQQQQPQQQQRQQICFVTQPEAPNQQQSVQSMSPAVGEDVCAQPAAIVDQPVSVVNKPVTQNRMDYVTHFGIQAPIQGKKASSETNISELVANLTTSIQPASQTSRVSNGTAKTKTSQNDSRKSQQPQSQHQQQVVRTYRFHNYDGDMINSHLYGSNNSDRQQANQQHKRSQAMKQLQDGMTRMAEQPAASHRSRQNSLSSICSTASCSSSPNSTSSASGSPANHSFAALKSPKGDNSSRSGSNNSPILIDEVRAN